MDNIEFSSTMSFQIINHKKETNNQNINWAFQVQISNKTQAAFIDYSRKKTDIKIYKNVKRW